MEHGSDAALSHYLRILKRGLWLVVLTTALATLGALYASHREQKLYRSSADVLLSSQNLAANLSNIQSSNEDPTRVAATQADLAQTPPVAYLALRLAHLTSRTPQQLLSHSSVSSASNADILTFSVTDPSPAVAQRLAQSYAIAYTRYRKQLDTASISQALKKVEVAPATSSKPQVLKAPPDTRTSSTLSSSSAVASSCRERTPNSSAPPALLPRPSRRRPETQRSALCSDCCSALGLPSSGTRSTPASAPRGKCRTSSTCRFSRASPSPHDASGAKTASSC